MAAALTIFEVLFQHLVTADLIFPHFRRDALEVFIFVNLHTPDSAQTQFGCYPALGT